MLTGNTSNMFAPVVLRLAIGFYFFVIGIWGYIEPELSSQAIRNYSNFSASFAGIYVSVACYIFFSAGLLLIAGLYTRSAAFAGGLLITPLLFGAGVFTSGSNNLSHFLEHRSQLREVVVLAGCFSLILTGGGALSLEGMVKGLLGRSG